jgi:hypothetical protein
LRPGATLEIHVQELAALTEEPIVVEGEDDWDRPLRHLRDEFSGQAGEVVNVSHVRLNLVEQASTEPPNLIVSVGVLEGGITRKRVVDVRDLEPLSEFPPQGHLRAIGAGLPGEDEDLVFAAALQSVREIVHVKLGTPGGGGRETMNDEKDPH